MPKRNKVKLVAEKRNRQPPDPNNPRGYAAKGKFDYSKLKGDRPHPIARATRKLY